MWYYKCDSKLQFVGNFFETNKCGKVVAGAIWKKQVKNSSYYEGTLAPG
jgi:hypothetical protein